MRLPLVCAPYATRRTSRDDGANAATIRVDECARLILRADTCFLMLLRAHVRPQSELRVQTRQRSKVAERRTRRITSFAPTFFLPPPPRLHLFSLSSCVVIFSLLHRRLLTIKGARVFVDLHCSCCGCSQTAAGARRGESGDTSAVEKRARSYADDRRSSEWP